MKKTLLSLTAILISVSSYAQYEGFENWTTNSVETLDDYQTSVNDWGVEGANAAYPENDAVTGVRSVKLETVITSSGDTLFGYILSGDFDTQAPGQAITLTGSVDSLIGFYKCNIQPNDSAVVFCMPTFNSVASGFGSVYFTTSQPTWKRFAFALNAPAADSMLLAIASSDAVNGYNGVPGTWLQLDDLQLKGFSGTQNIENYSFENWTTKTWDEPNSYTTSAIWGIFEPTLPVVKTTDMHAGSFAIELNTIQNQNGDTIAGIATNGDFNNGGVFGGDPYTANPVGLEFYYKNSVTGVDTGFVSVIFKNGGTIIGQYGSHLTPTGSYTQISQVISLPMNPDSVLITAFSGNNPGSTMKLDDIDFLFPVGISENLTVEKIVSYPNPATDVLKIKFNILKDNKVSIRLIDALGKELITRSLGNISAGTYRESFNTANFSTGIYFIEFTLGNEKVTERFMVK